MTSLEILARALCSIAGVDPEGMTTPHTPNWHEMRAQALQIETALVNGGYKITEAE